MKGESVNDYRDLIKIHEGFKHYVYLDTEGNETVGWGHCFFGENKPKVGKIYSNAECADFFDEDMQFVERDYIFLEDEFALKKIGPVRRAVLKNMLFNLGHVRLLGFKRMFTALDREDYSGAAAEMLDSKWAGQVKSRAKMLARMMETGKWQIL